MVAKVMRAAAGTVLLLPLVAPAPVQAEQRQVFVFLQNDNVVAPGICGRAKAEVSRFFAAIDVQILWAETPGAEDDVKFLKMTTWEPNDHRLPPTALGATYPGELRRNTRAYILWPRVQHYAQRYAVPVDKLLAAAIAHELGHLLLPSRSHANRGLMQTPWDETHFRAIASGRLQFSSQSAALIRRGLTAAYADSKAGKRR
ncbi:MAG TPA: hypothetical protein VFJ02_25940 [Vicinamibacterales bacterium]|nr:hypothetical protein [Vicinamibacterales bacterium]